MLKKKLASAFAATVLAAGSLVASAPDANAGWAGIDIWTACTTRYGSPQKSPVLVQYNVMGWRCRLPRTDGLVGIDLNWWCRYKHGSGAWATYSDFNNPYSWICVWK